MATMLEVFTEARDADRASARNEGRLGVSCWPGLRGWFEPDSPDGTRGGWGSETPWISFRIAPPGKLGEKAPLVGLRERPFVGDVQSPHGELRGERLGRAWSFPTVVAR